MMMPPMRRATPTLTAPVIEPGSIRPIEIPPH